MYSAKSLPSVEVCVRVCACVCVRVFVSVHECVWVFVCCYLDTVIFLLKRGAVLWQSQLA